MKKIRVQVVFETEELLMAVLTRLANHHKKDDQVLFDFNWLVREPSSREECPEEYINNIFSDESGCLWMLKNQWEKDHWGCFGNAQNPKVKNNVLSFEIDYDVPIKIFRELSTFGRIKVIYASDDYEIMGVSVYDDRELLDDVDSVSKALRELSRMVWKDHYNDL